MTQWERYRTLSAGAMAVECCMCDHRLSVPELEEFYEKVDEALHGEAFCRSCLVQHLQLCRECSGRYTADGLCSECSNGAYGRVG